MKNKKLIFPLFIIIFAIVSLSSCIILSDSNTTYEVWLFNDSTSTVDEWYIIDKESDYDGKNSISGNEKLYYNPTVCTIYPYNERGLSGIPAKKDYYIYLTFSGSNKIYYSDDFYLNNNKTVSVYYGTAKNRSAITDSEETELYLEDSEGNIYTLHKAPETLTLNKLTPETVREALK
ncbi:MAG: hypothetical protein SOT46_04580 [Treponema sp.]|nr:hypothetical protein [Treponema sp.]MDY5123219.1 hypothetical protein [Treponema sp.]